MLRSTLPVIPGIDDLHEERAELFAALAFVEGAGGFRREDLRGWFCTHAEALGLPAAPPFVRDALGGSVRLPLDGPPSVRHEDLSGLLSLARCKVILTLRGLLATPVDDRFLHAAIFSRRVRRHQGTWRVVAQDEHSLSEIVLALFAVDVLGHREFHEQNLCICDVCGRVSYNPARTTRARCEDHPPASPPESGARSRKRW
jgi:hypothetical protein